MKIAAGCFGCLTLVCLMLAAALTLGSIPISALLVEAGPPFNELALLVGYVAYAADGCCCLSAVITVALLAMGMSRGNNEAVE